MIETSWEMAQRENLTYGHPEFLKPQYRQTKSMISTNCSLKFEDMRVVLEAAGTPDPALLAHVDAHGVFQWENAPPGAFWFEYDKAMEDHYWPGDVRDPDFPNIKMCDPRTTPFATMLDFLGEWWQSAFESGQPNGIYLDRGQAFPWPRYQRMGFSYAMWLQCMGHWARGRTAFLFALRERFPGIKIVVNCGWDEKTPDFLKYVDGITYEGPMTTPKVANVVRSLFQCIRYNRRPYLVSWHDRGPWTKGLPWLQAGNHYMDRQP